MVETDRPDDGRSIMVADSDVLVRHAIADYLRHCGYPVVEAASFEEAIEVAEAAEFNTWLVLCDAQLRGGGNGFALRARLAELRPEVTVILAGNFDAAAKAAGELCEDGPHVVRPYDSSVVIDRIRRARAARERDQGG
jgi:CheY-like chemotaxis protein